MQQAATSFESASDQRPPLGAILLVSAAALAYEVLLIRLFSIIQWHHFAYMVISLALLGYGASGTFVTLMRRRLTANFSRAFLLNALLFSFTSVASFLLVQRLPFNTLELFWDKTQLGYLLIAYLLLFTPFFFAANCICISFSAFAGLIPRIYAFDLLGAGLGALAIVLLLYLLPPQDALRSIGVIGSSAAALSVLEQKMRWQGTLIPVTLTALFLLLPASWFALQISPYKALSQILQIGGTKVLEQHSSPLGLLTLVESSKIPLRLAEGVSLNNRVEPPQQLALFTDGDAPSPITRYNGDRESLAYLDYQTSALPYHLHKADKVLILGMGGGGSVLQAAYHQISEIHAVELDPWLPQLIQLAYAEFSGWRWLQDSTKVHNAEARSFIANTDERFDLIQMSLLDAAGATSGGVYGLSENYLYTVEALNEYLQKLSPGGLLTITRWMKLPPRDGLRLFATALEALRLHSSANPAAQLILIRGWNTSTLVIKNGELQAAEIEALFEFCQRRAFDIAYYPGMSDDHQANLHNILPEPFFHDGALALLGEQAGDYIDRYKFDIRPTTDDRPYFFNFFKWSTLPEIISLYRRGGFSLLELGYPVLILTLIQSSIVSLLLVLLPLRFIASEPGQQRHGYRWRVIGYFLVIGLAYLFIEMAFIQKLTLFLAHPVFAVAVVICGFLIFSGLGSLFASRIPLASGERYLRYAVVPLSVIALAYLWLLPNLIDMLDNPGMPVKAAAALLLIAPLAFCMGLPFPLGLAAVARNAPELVPWAWGINGCASLISAILATLLAVHWGFGSVILIAVVLYLIILRLYPS